MHRPEKPPAHDNLSAEDFIARSGWTHPHHDADHVVSAARVAAALTQWCHHATLIDAPHAFPDTQRITSVLDAMHAAANASTQLLKQLADHIDPHVSDTDPPAEETPPVLATRLFRHEPGEDTATLAELAAMSAAENLRDAMFVASGLTYTIERALRQFDHL